MMLCRRVPRLLFCSYYPEDQRKEDDTNYQATNDCFGSYNDSLQEGIMPQQENSDPAPAQEDPCSGT